MYALCMTSRNIRTRDVMSSSIYGHKRYTVRQMVTDSCIPYMDIKGIQQSRRGREAETAEQERQQSSRGSRADRAYPYMGMGKHVGEQQG